MKSASSERQRLPSGLVLAAVATLLWSGSFVLARGLSDDIPPLALNFWRWLIAFVVVAPVLVRRTRRAGATVRRHWRYLAVSAALGVTLYNALVYIAGRTTSALNLSLIAVMSPVFLVLLALIADHDRVAPIRWFGILTAAVGVVALLTDGSVGRLLGLRFEAGDLWMLCATLVFAAYSLLVRHRPAELETATFTFCTFGLGVILAAPAYAVEHTIVGGFSVNPATVSGLVYVGCCASVAAFVAWTKAIELAGPSRAAAIYYLVPVFTGIEGWLFLGEDVTVWQVASMMLVVAGTAISSVARGRAYSESKS